MSRIVKTDFRELVGFLESYSLSTALESADFLRLISQCHKKHFALMVFCSEMTERYPGTNKPTGKALARNTYLRNIYLQEFVSDMGGALFNWCHGAYKAARLLLRSSIENFVKGMSLLQDSSITSKTSVYEVFDLAAGLPVFSGRIEKSAFGRLRGIYGMLCADAHGAGIHHLQQTRSLNYFPGFDLFRAESAAKVFCGICQDALGVFCLHLPEVFLKMHHTNVDVLTPVLSKSVKRALHGIE